MTANKLTFTYMKLVLITAIAEFEKDVKKMLKEAKVKSYSYRDVKGFRDASEENVESNWFGTEMNETDSVVFYAFILQQNLKNHCLIYCFIEFSQEILKELKN